MEIRFRAHGKARVSERLSMTESELSELIKKGLYLKLGAERGTSKIHLLFYSVVDVYWFVAVFDEATSEVITVLPTDYHNRWVISDEAKRRAHLLATSATAIGRESALPKSVGSREGCPTVYRFCAVVEEGGKRRTVNLGSVPLESFGSLEEAYSDPQVRETLRTRLLAKGRPGVVFRYLLGQVGCKGEAVLIQLPAFP